MKSFSEIVLEAQNLEEKITQGFSFLGENNLKTISDYKCPLCEEGHLNFDSKDDNLIRCNNIFCNFRRNT